jgi:hypothetical protein
MIFETQNKNFSDFPEMNFWIIYDVKYITRVRGGYYNLMGQRGRNHAFNDALLIFIHWQMAC